MTVVILFLAVVAGIAGWWLSRQRLASKPWLESGHAGELPGTGAIAMPAAKLGLGFFLVVVGALFALLVSAWFIRMGLPDWGPLPVSRQLWLNTGALILSSAALHSASVGAHRGQLETVRYSLLGGAILALAFVVGQLVAWRELVEAGYFLASNPASSFFYLVTGLHGLHMLGGIVALARTTRRAWRAGTAGEVRLGVDLCATYWHFMLAIWLVLFALLAGLADDLAHLVVGGGHH